MSNAQQKLNDIRTNLKSSFFERETVVDGMLTALIARLHIFLLGPPGTGKSALVNSVVGAVDDATSFKWLMTRFSTPEELFGPVSLSGLKNDKYERVVDGKLPTAHVAYLDEVFKANSAILNSCLTMMNERAFDNGTQRIECPLETLVGSSNELPEGPELGALFDRFTFRYFVDYIKSPGLFRDLLQATHGDPEVTATLTLDELHELQQRALDTEISDSVLDKMIAIKDDLLTQGIVISDRAWRQMVQVLKARAVLEDEQAVSTDHLEALSDCLWQSPEQIQTVATIIGKHSNPRLAEVVENLDIAQEAFDNYPNKVTEDNFSIAVRLRREVKQIMAATEEIVDEEPSVRLTETLKEIAAIKKEMDKRFSAYAEI